ncbi:MAG: ergothioneine biosynthesis protein EgtB [Sumerlaeia bacterium]
MPHIPNDLLHPAAPAAAPPQAPAREALLEHYRRVRAFTETLCEPLETEDYIVQTMPDVSPAKWHIAHVSWFFETFLLKPNLRGYREIDPLYAYMFNSYYNAAGPMHCRPRRGTLSRPTVAQCFAYRHHVDRAMERLILGASDADFAQLAPIVTLGIHHEQQHQELLLTDIKNVFTANPMRPVYKAAPERPAAEAIPLRWLGFEGGIRQIGHAGGGFAYDNESPRHDALLRDFELANRCVTNGEWMEFMAGGGYRDPLLWLSAGWATIKETGWDAPYYWEKIDGQWMAMTMNGLRPIDPARTVCHVSYFEADAFARWSGCRLPTEFEWEAATEGLDPAVGNFVDNLAFEPAAAPGGPGLRQAFGNVWEWTMSQYSPYPGYKAAPGALGEYNGKFMCNQFVLRGGSCATSRSHIRRTYRNFFQPEARWQFTGLRLAKDA